MAQFLSDEWFTMVAQYNDQAGDLHLPPTLSYEFNASLTDDDTISLHLKDGKIVKGLSDNAVASIKTNRHTLQKLIAGKDLNAVLGAFMMGKIRIEGDMSKILSLQSAKPTPEQKALYKAILAQTQFD